MKKLVAGLLIGATVLGGGLTAFAATVCGSCNEGVMLKIVDNQHYRCYKCNYCGSSYCLDK